MTCAELARAAIDLSRRISQIERENVSRPVRSGSGGGGGGGNFRFYSAATKSALPDVDAPALGYVTTSGRYYLRHGTGESGAWDCLDFLE